jgi:hypothetical protein
MEKEKLIKILEDLRETPKSQRRSRLTRLHKPILVQVAEVMLQKWERERHRMEVEIEKRDFHIERLEALMKTSKR